MELAQSSLDQNEEDSAIKNLDLLINKFPEDSLASLAQYKLVNIYKKNLEDNIFAFSRTDFIYSLKEGFKAS